MPTIIMMNGANKLDGSIKAAVFTFLEKIQQDDTLPGLHIEPLHDVADQRVRTGRVNQNFRAVLFKVSGGDEAAYVFTGAWPHDEAIKVARGATLTMNPVNGVPEILIPTTELTAALPGQSHARPSAAPGGEHGPAEPAEGAALAAAEPEREAAERPSLLGEFGISRADLIDVLGLDAELADLALEAVDEDEVLALAELAVPWQGSALLSLAAGSTVAQAREELGLTGVVAEAEGLSEDERLVAALAHPAARLQFAFIEDDQELRSVIEGGDLSAWRTFLHPEQRKYASTDYNGPFRLSGGAGTGKTVVLIHRARELARRDRQARILLTTYTKTLAAALRADLERLDPGIRFATELGEPGVYVASLDAVATRVLKGMPAEVRDEATRTAIGPRTGELNPGSSGAKLWASVLSATSVPLDPALANPTFLAAEYALVVLPARITTRDEYFAVRRPGRGVALDRSKRAAVWQLIQSFRSAASIEDTIDWPELSAITAVAVEQTGPVFDHVLVDEGQDLTPSQWQLLRALAAPGKNDLFLAEDSHQRIYGHPLVLSRLGINIVGRSRRLTLNYRTTAQNLRFALGVLAGEAYVDAEGEAESVAGYRSARRGPSPQPIAAASITEELDTAARTVRSWLDEGHSPEAIGILVRDQQQMSRVVTGLNERGVGARQVDGSKSAGTGQAVVMTMHRAKGMEFECVIIFGASRDDLPAEYLIQGVTDEDRAEFLQRERSLLYVSATRARDELVILWSGAPSELLPR